MIGLNFSQRYSWWASFLDDLAQQQHRLGRREVSDAIEAAFEHIVELEQEVEALDSLLYGPTGVIQSIADTERRRIADEIIDAEEARRDARSLSRSVRRLVLLLRYWIADTLHKDDEAFTWRTRPDSEPSPISSWPQQPNSMPSPMPKSPPRRHHRRRHRQPKPPS